MDWHRAGLATEERITQLRMKYAAAAEAAGIDTSSLWKLRTGKGAALSEQLRRRVDRALRWPEGTIDRIADDPDYTPPSGEITDEQRLDQLEARVETLASLVERLTEEVRRLAG